VSSTSFVAPAVLSATSVSKSFATRSVLLDVSLTVAPGERIGVVGPNGSGKTTLLKLLAGLVEPDSGHVERSRSTMTVGYLPQESSSGGDLTLLEFIGLRTGVARAAGEMEVLAARMDDALDSIQAYTDSVERYVALGGEDLEARGHEVLDLLGLDASLNRRLGSLSGGQRARAQLAGLLLARFDVFLLDEPTNDLDFDGLELIEDFVDAAAGGMVVVSHDRAFLERCVTSVLELDQVKGARTFAGGYDAYLRERESAERALAAAYEQYQTERKRLADEARRRRARSTSGAAKARRSPSDPDKFIRSGHIEKAENAATKARVIERRLKRLVEVDKPFEGWRLELSFGDAPRSAGIVARLEEAVVRRGDFVLGPLDLEIRWGDRVLVTGPNGSGKSTLVDALIGVLPLDAGRRRIGPRVRIGVMDQDRRIFEQDRPWLEVFRERSGLLDEEARSLLAKFSLTAEHAARVAWSLSPGERSRATLALLAAQRANLLVLDEPTNHLDLEAIEQLEEALRAFGGTVVLVTHDRRLIEAFSPTHRVSV